MDDRVTLSLTQVRALAESQFPQWAALDIRPVEHSGWDNRSYRLGETMIVRFPSAERYVAQVEKEHRWLPYLAARLPLPIPTPLGMGRPSKTYPWPWSIYRWLDGEPLALEGSRIDKMHLADDVAAFLRALNAIDPDCGPPAGTHNFHRGGSLAVYDDETRNAIDALSDEIDAGLAREVWELALGSHWQKNPVWVHGDIAAGNLLMGKGRLCAVIDFGSCAVGDPACDLVLAWTMLDSDSRAIFRDRLARDAATWQRARGWALWKALITLVAQRGRDETLTKWSRRTIREVFADHRSRSPR